MFSNEKNIEILRKALRIIAEEEAAALPSEEEVSHITFSEEYRRKMDKLIRRQKRPYFRFVNTVGKRVACIVIAALIALTSLTFGVEAIREKVIDFFVETFEKFSTVFYDEEDIPADVEFIETYYAPTYIPEGYELVKEDKRASHYNLRYEFEMNNYIYYSQYVIDNHSVYLDTEYASAESIVISGYDAYYSDKDKKCVVFWNDANYSYTITTTTDLSKKEIINIAESLEPK